jgi:hypothetical protein
MSQNRGNGMHWRGGNPYRKAERHIVKSFHWKYGRLHLDEMIFETIEEAIEHANTLRGLVKVFNEAEEMIFCSDHDADGTPESYQ